MTEGTLVVVNNKTVQIQFTNSKGKPVQFNVKESELSATLMDKRKNAIAELNAVEVEFELIGGQPQKIREKGQSFQSHNMTTAPSGKNERSPSNKSSRDNRPASETARGDFHNPYNFVPALPRNSDQFTTDLAKELGDLGESDPAPHGVYCADRWSGKIAVTLTTKTPLLIPDAANLTEDEKGHKTYPLRVVDGKPYLPPTSIKGMLRSAYEAVTNSRLSVFQGHGDRLAYRTPAEGKSNQYIYPARVEQRDNQLYLRILAAPDLLDKAGKLPRYRTQAQTNELDKGESELALTYDGSSNLPQHGDSVWVRLNLEQNDETNLPRAILNNLEVGLKKQPDGSVKLPKSVVTRIQKRKSGSKPPGTGDWRKGWVCITGANINSKRYERVFIEDDDDQLISITEDTGALQKLWKDLILDYQKQHKRDLEKRQEVQPKPQQPQDYLGDEPGKTGWSTHVYQEGMEVLDVATLCYVELKTDLEDSSLTLDQVNAIVPVVLSRRLYASSPEDLLDQSLKPGENRSKLSPADRVFGWVNQQSKGAYKGNLRIGPVQCLTEQWCEDFGDAGLPLAILGQPKPQQARFYIAKDQQGNPLDNGAAKADGYQKSQGLRGRKVYAHHRDLPGDYWADPLSDRTQQAQNREYRRPQIEVVEQPDPKKPKLKNAQLPKPQRLEQRDDQNRSIQAWVKPDVTFSFTIDVTNLLNVELGALLWLLNLPENHYHRLGGGKPLGFGSVRLEINWDNTDLRKGEDWQQYYRSLLQPLSNLNPREAEATVQQFQESFEQAYGNGKKFADIPLIQAFCRCAKGFEDGLPIHYPRVRKPGQTGAVPPHPDGKAFEWFVENERSGNSGGPKVALPPLWDETGLPILPSK